MAIRVLRILEYQYETPERAADDMKRWTHNHWDRTMIMKSAVIPFDLIEWKSPEYPTPREKESDYHGT
jgi:hypothetical protein